MTSLMSVGLAMITMAMVPPQRQQVPSTAEASQMQMFSSHPLSSYQSQFQGPNVSHITQHYFYGNMTSTTFKKLEKDINCITF